MGITSSNPDKTIIDSKKGDSLSVAGWKLKGLYLASKLISDKVFQINKHLSEILFSNDIWSYVKLKLR